LPVKEKLENKSVELQMSGDRDFICPQRISPSARPLRLIRGERADCADFSENSAKKAAQFLPLPKK
jgi:hypothetical protein